MVVIELNLAENRRLACQTAASIATNLPNLTTPELYTCEIIRMSNLRVGAVQHTICLWSPPSTPALNSCDGAPFKARFQ
jgi:hypothetical protein